MGGRFLGGSPVLLLTSTAGWLLGGPAHHAQEPAAPDRVMGQCLQVAIQGGRPLPFDHLGQRVSQWLFTQPVLRCSTGPSVEPSRNRAVIQAGVPHWGQGWCRAFASLSWVGRARDPMSGCGAVVVVLADVSAARIGRAGVGEQCRRAHGRSAVRHHLTMDCLVTKPETARSVPVP
jgi:hypothetical protein